MVLVSMIFIATSISDPTAICYKLDQQIFGRDSYRDTSTYKGLCDRAFKRYILVERLGHLTAWGAKVMGSTHDTALMTFTFILHQYVGE